MKPEDNFLPVISKATIIIPVVVLVIGLALSGGRRIQSPTTSPTPTVQIESNKTEKLKINLKGPLVCEGSYKDSEIKASVKNKRVFAEVDDANEGITNYVLNGDCLYSWQKGKVVGTKTCGLTTFISIFELLGNVTALPLAIDEDKLQDFLKNCNEKEIKDERIFEIPKNFSFKETGLNELIKPK